MGIAQKLARDFSDAVRSRGQSYFAKGRVAVTASVPGEVLAKVRGTAKYRVRLRMRGSKLHVSCSCPYYVPAGEPCKHLWATILLADARNLLQAPPVRPLRLVCDPPRRARGAEPTPGPSPGPGPGPGRARGYGPAPVSGPGPVPEPGRPKRSRKGRRDRAAGPPWKEGATGAPRAKAVNRGSKRLLVFILDVPATLSQNQVVIDLARRQRRPTGDWGPLKPWWHSPATPAAKYDPEDLDLLTVLEERSRSTPRAGPTAWARGPSPMKAWAPAATWSAATPPG